TGAGLLAAAGDIPTGGGWQGAAKESSFRPYVVVWPIAGSMFDGTLAQADEDCSWPFQISGWGPSAEAAERTTDTARTALLTATLTIPGRNVLRVRPDGGLGVTADDSLQPRLWHSRDRYRIDTGPD